MKVREIRELNHDDMRSRIEDTRKSIVELRFQLAMRKLESPAKLRQARKQLARLLTIQSEKTDAEIGANPKTEAKAPTKVAVSKTTESKAAAPAPPVKKESKPAAAAAE